MFKMMKSSHIGLHHPEFFLHWADFEVKVDRRDKSLAVLASAHDTPIMRGNPQIKEAKELIESDKNLNLDVLFTLNTTFKPQNLIIPSKSIGPNMIVQNSSTSQNALPATNAPCKFLGETFSDKLSKLNNNRSEVVALLGPAKRVKEESFINKENQEPFSLDNTNFTGHSNNSNMSLTMTELNILKTTPGNKEPEDSGTYNLTNNTLLNTNNISSKVSSNNPNNAVAITTSNNVALKSRQVRVNGKIYRVLQLIGRGGSSKVFRVIDAEGQIFALKKVNLKNLDEITVSSYINEISLLKRFSNDPHIIQLIDSEMNKEQGCLYILMEYGEVDLGKMLKNRVDNGLIGDKADENFIRFSFQQVKEYL